MDIKMDIITDSVSRMNFENNNENNDSEDEWNILLQMGKDFKDSYQNKTEINILKFALDKFQLYLAQFTNSDLYSTPRMKAHMAALKTDILNYINLYNIHSILYADKKKELVELGYKITSRIYYTRIEIVNGYDDYYPNNIDVSIECYDPPTFDLDDLDDPDRVDYEQSVMLMAKLL